MREPTQAEVDAITTALVTADSPGCERGAVDWALWRDDSQYWRKQALAAILALDTLRGPCVPIDVLKAKLEQSHEESIFGRTDRLIAWLDRRGWRDK
jgi:hypothetical protein